MDVLLGDEMTCCLREPPGGELGTTRSRTGAMVIGSSTDKLVADVVVCLDKLILCCVCGLLLMRSDKDLIILLSSHVTRFSFQQQPTCSTT